MVFFKAQPILSSIWDQALERLNVPHMLFPLISQLVPIAMCSTQVAKPGVLKTSLHEALLGVPATKMFFFRQNPQRGNQSLLIECIKYPQVDVSWCFWINCHISLTWNKANPMGMILRILSSFQWLTLTSECFIMLQACHKRWRSTRSWAPSLAVRISWSAVTFHPSAQLVGPWQLKELSMKEILSPFEIDVWKRCCSKMMWKEGK